jgi:hypothetical protein
VKPAHPGPEFYTRWEGGEWQPWKGQENAPSAHSILFSDGSVLDMFNGWRQLNYSDKLRDLRRHHNHS